MSFWQWRPYVSVAEKKQRSEQAMKKLAQKHGSTLTPIRPESRKIAQSFWGTAWCHNLESYSDYANRLPRGRSYIRNGSVLDLKISQGIIEAYVAGSDVYKVKVEIKELNQEHWQRVKDQCIGRIDSIMELLSGKLSNSVIEVITTKVTGLFPAPKEIKMSCSCPDSARMCKHVAATLYGVGTLLDKDPTLFFKLRNVDHRDLIVAATDALGKANAAGSQEPEEDLADLFGIDLATARPLPAIKAASAELTKDRDTDKAAKQQKSANSRKGCLAKKVKTTSNKTKSTAKSKSARGQSVSTKEQTALIIAKVTPKPSKPSKSPAKKAKKKAKATKKVMKATIKRRTIGTNKLTKE